MKVTENAYAKINIFLDVTAKRADGFHDIKTVMQSVDLFDTLEMDCSRSEHTELSLRIEGGDPIPVDENNLICKAVLAYLSASGLYASVRMKLTKRIPVGAGLGGGSSDAAAALRGMNRVFKCFEREGLLKLAEKLGSDVAFCLEGGTALCEGKGELMTPLKRLMPKHLVIAIGSARVSTPEAYRALDALYTSFDGSIPTGGEERFDEVMSTLEEGRLPVSLFNVFEKIAESEHPEITEIKNELQKLGAVSALMSGSGASVFGVFDSEERAKAAAAKLASDGLFAKYCMTL